MKYLKKFNDQYNYDLFKSSADYILPNVSYIQSVNKIIFNHNILLGELFDMYTLTTYTLPTFQIKDELLNTFKL